MSELVEIAYVIMGGLVCGIAARGHFAKNPVRADEAFGLVLVGGMIWLAWPLVVGRWLAGRAPKGRGDDP